MIISSNKNLFAISFDTATYRVLSHFVTEHDGYTLQRIDPLEFLSTNNFPDGSFINLVIKDFNLRKEISFYIDNNNLEKFTLIHDSSYANHKNIGPGCIIYSLSSMYPTAILQKDVIVHSNSLIGEQCQIGAGSFISGGVVIGGSVTIGEYCQINISSVFYDKISIASDSTIGAGSVVRKNISVSGTYSGLLKNKIQKLK